MADVADTLAEWSSTTDSNAPSNATTIGTGLAPNLREIQAVVVRGLSHKGSDIASAATTDIGGTEGSFNDVTGTTAITGLGTVRAGLHKWIKFEGALTLTHNATSLILPGAANITTADGDVAHFVSEGSGNWRCLSYLRANGSHLGPVLTAAQALSTQTDVSFTSIPPWVKKITIMFAGVSTSGTDAILVQVGDSDGVEEIGYLGASSQIVEPDALSTTNYTAGFGIQVSAAATVLHGSMVLSLINASTNTWVCHGTFGSSDATRTFLTGGSKSVSATLDRVNVTTVGGSDTFDAGSISVMYE